MTIKAPAKAARPPKAAAPYKVQQTGEIPKASSEHPRVTQNESSLSADSNGATITASNGARLLPRASTSASSDSLLSPRDILTRLNITSADPTKWMRRTFKKHGVPYVHTCGKMRATEAQYRLLLERMTCSPSVPAAKTASTISDIQSRLATSTSTSKGSVQERVTRMLRRA